MILQSNTIDYKIKTVASHKRLLARNKRSLSVTLRLLLKKNSFSSFTTKVLDLFAILLLV